MTFKSWEIIGLIALALLWLLGLWKSASVLKTQKQRRSKHTPKAATPIDIPIISILFYFAHTVTFLGLCIRLIGDPTLYRLALLLITAGQLTLVFTIAYCNFNTEIEPKLIDLSLKHELQTQPRYEDVISQIRPIWQFERPILTGIGMLILLTGGALSGLFWTLEPFAWIAAFGFHLIAYTAAFGKITVLTVRTDDIVIKRWLDNPHTLIIPAHDIGRVEIDETFFHSLWKASALVITDTDGIGTTLVVKQADEIKNLIESLPIPPEPEPETP